MLLTILFRLELHYYFNTFFGKNNGFFRKNSKKQAAKIALYRLFDSFYRFSSVTVFFFLERKINRRITASAMTPMAI